MAAAEIQQSNIVSRLTELLGQDVISMDRVGGGRNSKVFQVTCANLNQYLAKLYFRHPSDARDRLKAEFFGLLFLWQSGVTCIPRPIKADEKIGLAVYDLVRGKRIPGQDVAESDIDQATEFLETLRGLTERAGSQELPSASEACFSAEAVLENIRLRLARLNAVSSEGPTYQALSAFFGREFSPALEEISAWCLAKLASLGISASAELAHIDRTLSPSDFGFHNALRRDDGKIVFLDFEYFGWDDPAKTISDFLLHPAMDLTDDLKRRFVSQILSRFKDVQHLAERIEYFFPMFGLKWCLIMLNEFVPEDLSRRRFANEIVVNKREVQMQQLALARRMLGRIRRDYEEFPYAN